MRRNFLRSTIAVAMFVALGTPGVFAGPQSGTSRAAASQNPAASSSSIIWSDPGDVSSLDFVGGPGGAENAPKPPFKFIEEDPSGSAPKLKVEDANGVKWGVKFGSEVNAEVFASRMAWAAGYFVEPSYFVASGKIEGVSGLGRAKKYVAKDGGFTNGRFELKSKEVKKLKDEQAWLWNQNPFVGTKELNGLKVIVMLTSNWDNKDARDVSRGVNTQIWVYPDGTQHYLITDWGGSMGKWGGVMGREKWDCRGFAKQTPDFLKGGRGGSVEFGYSGQHTGDWKTGISAADVQWVTQYLSQISDDQLRAGLKTAGATGDEVECFTKSIRDRINQLKSVQ